MHRRRHPWANAPEEAAGLARAGRRRVLALWEETAGCFAPAAMDYGG
ncbi:hypothetical protein [Azospirillum thermophilum]|nr:hypothetical protein [Azospirillum thermophilum]